MATDLRAELLKLNFKAWHIDSAIRSGCLSRKEAIAHITDLIQSIIRVKPSDEALSITTQNQPPFLKIGSSAFNSFKKAEQAEKSKFLQDKAFKKSGYKPENDKKENNGGFVPENREFLGETGESFVEENFRNRIALRMAKTFNPESSLVGEELSKRYLAEETADRERMERNKISLQRYEIDFCDLLFFDLDYFELYFCFYNEKRRFIDENDIFLNFVLRKFKKTNFPKNI